jgi:hypothetical protein
MATDVHKATQHDPYQLGWDDGYAEGYACRLSDVTESFMPPQNDFQVEAAARWVHSRMAAHITYVDAIGLVRGMVREGMKA